MRWLIRFYQRYVSPYLAPHCRFQPTCSEYADAAIARFGVARGSWLALRRISRCQPLGGSGYDPVPAAYRWWGRSESDESSG